MFETNAQGRHGPYWTLHESLLQSGIKNNLPEILRFVFTKWRKEYGIFATMIMLSYKQVMNTAIVDAIKIFDAQLDSNNLIEYFSNVNYILLLFTLI